MRMGDGGGKKRGKRRSRARGPGLGWARPGPWELCPVWWSDLRGLEIPGERGGWGEADSRRIAAAGEGGSAMIIVIIIINLSPCSEVCHSGEGMNLGAGGEVD